MRTWPVGCGVIAAVLLGAPSVARADAPDNSLDGRLARATAAAWTADASSVRPIGAAPRSGRPAPVVTIRDADVFAPSAFTVQPRGRAARTGAGPNIGTVGLGGIGGLSDIEIGPSFRYWATERVGVQAHLGFSGDDIGPQNVEFIRFEPTVIVAIGDFGEGAVNFRPYAGGGARIVRTDIGAFNDAQVKPVGVGGVEFGFRATPRFNASVELSVAPDIDSDDFNLPRRGPRLTGVRIAALAHYFF